MHQIFRAEIMSQIEFSWRVMTKKSQETILMDKLHVCAKRTSKFWNNALITIGCCDVNKLISWEVVQLHFNVFFYVCPDVSMNSTTAICVLNIHFQMNCIVN